MGYIKGKVLTSYMFVSRESQAYRRVSYPGTSSYLHPWLHRGSQWQSCDLQACQENGQRRLCPILLAGSQIVPPMSGLIILRLKMGWA